MGVQSTLREYSMGVYSQGVSHSGPVLSSCWDPLYQFGAQFGYPSCEALCCPPDAQFETHSGTHLGTHFEAQVAAQKDTYCVHQILGVCSFSQGKLHTQRIWWTQLGSRGLPRHPNGRFRAVI